MNRIRSCFITVVIIIFLGSLVFLCVALSGERGGPVSGIFSPTKNFLFLGVDDREETEFQGRTDTILILHIAGWGRKDSLLSIPRDTRVNLEGHGYNKINAAYVYGGKKMLIDEIHKLTGISIDRTMLLNFEGFKRIIDILGGVTIEITEPMHDPLSGANFDPGVYHMDGEQALAYARCRATAKADLDRVGRQQELLGELIRQKVSFSTVTKMPQIFAVLEQETVSNFSMVDYASVGFLMFFSSEDMNRLTIPTEGATIDGISYLIADPDEVKQYLSGYMEID
ncbi:MAG: LCP family protein [Actinomycetota bacterium]